MSLFKAPAVPKPVPPAIAPKLEQSGPAPALDAKSKRALGVSALRIPRNAPNTGLSIPS